MVREREPATAAQVWDPRHLRARCSHAGLSQPDFDAGADGRAVRPARRPTGLAEADGGDRSVHRPAAAGSAPDDGLTACWCACWRPTRRRPPSLPWRLVSGAAAGRTQAWAGMRPAGARELPGATGGSRTGGCRRAASTCARPRNSLDRSPGRDLRHVLDAPRRERQADRYLVDGCCRGRASVSARHSPWVVLLVRMAGWPRSEVRCRQRSVAGAELRPWRGGCKPRAHPPRFVAAALLVCRNRPSTPARCGPDLRYGHACPNRCAPARRSNGVAAHLRTVDNA